MKKFLAILMCAMMLIGVAACAKTPAPATEAPAAEYLDLYYSYNLGPRLITVLINSLILQLKLA